MSDALRHSDRARLDDAPARVLDHQALVRVLLASGYVSARSFQAGLEISRFTRRHTVWSVHVPGHIALVVKQARSNAGWTALDHEATMYAMLRATTGISGDAIPRLLGIDKERQLLILELIDGRSIIDHQRVTHRLPVSAAATLGNVLAQLHHLQFDRRLLTEKPPWVLKIHQPDRDWYMRSSEASLRLRSIIQESPVIGPAFEALWDASRSEALVHGDLKLHHVIIRRRSPSAPGQRIAMIDWETSQAGDAAWDIGTIIAGYLSLWLRSIPLVHGRPSSQLMHEASVPLAAIQRSLFGFWSAYMRASGNSIADDSSLLSRSVSYAAARLIQLEDERLQDASSLTRRTHLIVDVCENILLQPVRAASVLAGMTADHEPAR